MRELDELARLLPGNPRLPHHDALLQAGLRVIEFERKQAKPEAYQEETGKKPRGKEPKAPSPGPRAKDQVNLTDEESRIMPTSSGGFEQAYNAQAGVDIDTHLIVEEHVTQPTKDQQEVAARIRLHRLP